jgi:PilZ domain
MSAAILVVMPEGYQGRAFVAKFAPALTSSRVRKSIYNILEADAPGVLAQIVGAAERFGFSYRVLDAGPLLPRWPLRIIFPHERGERRIAPRHRVLRSGQIILGKRASVIDCTVRNFSSTGAAIWLPNAAALPPKFDLLFDNAIRHCIVVWRRVDLMGVKFRSESDHR